MSKSKEFIRAKLENRLQAACSTSAVKNNRIHYFLRFDEAIGFDWVHAQVKKASAEIGTPLEMWKIRPSGMKDFEVEVREIERREGIDDSQRGLDSFEE